MLFLGVEGGDLADVEERLILAPYCIFEVDNCVGATGCVNEASVGAVEARLFLKNRGRDDVV
jgi:hypothetical protein